MMTDIGTGDRDPGREAYGWRERAQKRSTAADTTVMYTLFRGTLRKEVVSPRYDAGKG